MTREVMKLVQRDASYRRYPTAPAAVALRYEDLVAGAVAATGG